MLEDCIETTMLLFSLILSKKFLFSGHLELYCICICKCLPVHYTWSIRWVQYFFFTYMIIASICYLCIQYLLSMYTDAIYPTFSNWRCTSAQDGPRLPLFQMFLLTILPPFLSNVCYCFLSRSLYAGDFNSLLDYYEVDI